PGRRRERVGTTAPCPGAPGLRPSASSRFPVQLYFVDAPPPSAVDLGDVSEPYEYIATFRRVVQFDAGLTGRAGLLAGHGHRVQPDRVADEDLHLVAAAAQVQVGPVHLDAAAHVEHEADAGLELAELRSPVGGGLPGGGGVAVDGELRLVRVVAVAALHVDVGAGRGERLQLGL